MADTMELITHNPAMELTTQNPYTNAGQATVNGFANNLSYKPTVEELNRTITGDALQNTPFDAVHPARSGRRNRPITSDDNLAPLGPAVEIGPRLHASGRPMLRAKKK